MRNGSENPPLARAHRNDWVQLTVLQVVIKADSEEHFIFLRQVDGPVVFPIAVGFCEAAAVRHILREPVSSRPLTHELFHTVVKGLGGKILYALIEDLLSGVFYAKLALQAPHGDCVDIDCRPSDAVCVALDCGVPIFAPRALLRRLSTASL